VVPPRSYKQMLIVDEQETCSVVRKCKAAFFSCQEKGRL
jgi:hypothetical protein